MKKIIVCGILVSLSTAAAFGSVKFCGKLTSLAFETDIYTNIRMGIVNSKNSPKFITVKDSTSIEYVISVVSGNSDYIHESDMDDYRWNYKNEKRNNYFICVTSSKELREYRSNYYLDSVRTTKVWKNGKLYQ